MNKQIQSLKKKGEVYDIKEGDVFFDDNHPLIDFKNFTFRYGDKGQFALRNINLSVKKGEIILLGGYSGSGKSTLCNAFSGRIPHEIKGQMAGEIKLFGKDIWDHNQSDIYQKISYVFQNADEQLVTFRVFDELAFAAENFLLKKDEIQKRIHKVAKSLEITDLLSRSINQLSGGEKQKVVLAANMIIEPKILILDEPLAFLDGDGEELLIQYLEKIHNENPEMAIVIAEHRLRPFIGLISKIVLLNQKGAIDFVGNPMNYRKYIEKNKINYLRDSYSYEKNISSKEKDSNLTIQNNVFLKLKNISFTYPGTNKEIFNNLNIEIKKGEYIGLEGNNGCGKTTLLYLITQVLKPITGNVLLEEKNIKNISIKDFLPRIGFIFQNPENQIFEHTIVDEILYAPRNFENLEKQILKTVHKKDKSNEQNTKKQKNKIKSNAYAENKSKTIEELINIIGEKRVDSEDMKNKNPFCLSWGQKRRLNLASIFSYEPDILLIDEPFIGQDIQSVNRILSILKQYHKKGVTIIIISHDRELLHANCTRIINLDNIKESKIELDQIKTDSNRIKTDSEQIKIESPAFTDNKRKKKTKKKSYNKKRTKKWEKLNLFMNDQENFSPETSFIHKLNPLMKMGLLIAFTLFLFSVKYIIILFSVFFLILLTAKVSNLPLKQFLRQIRWLWYLTIVYVPLNTLFEANIMPNDEILFYLFSENLPIYRIAFYYSIRTGLIIINLFSAAVIYSKTISMKDLQYTLMQAGVPYRYAFSFVIGLRYVPILQNESHKIKIAQRLRGSIVSKKSSVKQVFNHIFHQINTLLISILRKAKTTSVSIEARGFGYQLKRTNLYRVKWKKKDKLGLIVGIFLILILIMILNGMIFPITIPSLL